MTQQDIRELAKQGNPKALATLINNSLKPKNITAKVGVKDDCIQILLESDQVPDQEAIVPFIRNGLIKLEVSINTVKVYGRQRGDENPAWNQTFELMPIQDTPVISEEIEPLIPPISPWEEIENPIISTSKARQTTPQSLSKTSATSQNINSRQSSELSVGNVVSAALRIYRDRFKVYWRLAFTAYLWLLVPVYGWAKHSAILALIGRLAYSEVVERPETVEEARRQVMPRMWSFLGAGFLVGLIVPLVMFVAFFVLSFFGGVLAAILGQNATATIILVLVGIIAFSAFLIGYIRLICRFLIVEMPLAMEDNLTATSTISRSWQLTKGFVGHLQWIFFVAFLITLPLSIVIQLISLLIQGFVGILISRDSSLFFLVYYMLLLPFSFATGSLLIPFWQSIKAVVYYDLRSRKEGLGLQLRDS